MFTICWIGKDGITYWERCNDHIEAMQVLTENELMDDPDVIILSPLADAHLLAPEEVETWAD